MTLVCKSVVLCSISTAAHGMQTWSTDENSVRLPVCLQYACNVTKWYKDLSKFLYHIKDHLAWFSQKKNGWWGRHLPEMLGQSAPRWSEVAYF